jgi:hypothetical protein
MSLFETLKNAMFHSSVAAKCYALRANVAFRQSRDESLGRRHPLPALGPSAGTIQPSSAGVNCTASLRRVLEALNARSPQKLYWRSSIVDLMKLVGLD